MWDTQWASNTPKVERETAEKFHPEKGLEVAKAHVNNCPWKLSHEEGERPRLAINVIIRNIWEEIRKLTWEAENLESQET